MISEGTSFTHWKGGGITNYSWYSGDNSLTLVENAGNFIEIWITFVDGSITNTRIEL
jgi:hypothetical protein